MELIKEKEEYLEVLNTGTEKIPVDGDVIVPDVKPDVLKVLQVDAFAGITDKGITNGAVYVEGRLNVNILYIPDSEEEGIGCIKASFNFKDRIENPEFLPEMMLKISCDVSRVEFTLLNSRKLSVKAAVACSYEVVGEKNLEIPCGFDGECGECIKEPVIIDTIGAQESCDFIVRDSMEISSGKQSVKEILKTDYKICDKQIKAVSGKLIVKGTLQVCVLYSACDCSVDFCEAEFPFTEVFDVYDLSENDSCNLDLAVGDISAELCEDNDGDMRVINIECLINASLRACRKKEFNMINDCYCPGMDTKLDYSEAVIKKYIDEIKSQSNIKEVISPDPKLPQIVKVYNVIAEAEFTKISSENSKILTEGKIKAYILYLTDNAKCAVYSFKKDIPFSFSFDCANAVGNMTFDAEAGVEYLSYNLNAAGEIELRCTLEQNIKITKKEKINIISEANTCERQEKKDIVIYFVKKGDSLWKIAKRYAVKTEDIKCINSMESDEIFCGQKLLIPVCK
ncbi:MAG: DUF3794 domain-containing protein [Clostridia bacterium]|nr:DUF3794 domain-containing protein [Clostridia bacterium]